MTVFKHKRSGERISMDRITELVKIYGLEGKIAINNPDYVQELFKKPKASIYRLVDIPFNSDFELDKISEFTEDDLIEIVYETKPCRVRDKAYRLLKEMRNKCEI